MAALFLRRELQRNVAALRIHDLNGVISSKRIWRTMPSQRPQSHERYLACLRTLTGAVAHDINNLLSGISGYSELLLLDLSAENLRFPVEEIKAAGKRIAELSQLLSAFTEKHTYHPERLNLNDAILSVKRTMAGILGEKTELLINPAPELWPVRADKAKIKQALITVAIEIRNLMPEGGVLRLSTQNVPSVPDPSANESGPAAGYVVATAVSSGPISVDDVLHSLLAPRAVAEPDADQPAAGLPSVADLAQLASGYSIINSYSPQELSLSIYLPAAD